MQRDYSGDRLSSFGLLDLGWEHLLICLQDRVFKASQLDSPGIHHVLDAA